jgi:diguanylate cyclase (GGDEF)-like protein
MNAPLFIQVALTSTSVAISLILWVAWHEFGRARHAATWALGFALAALMAAVGLAGIAFPALPHIHMVIFAVAGFASALNTLGFRQRAGLPEGRRTLLALATAHAAMQGIIALSGGGLLLALVPLNLLNVLLFWLAANTLQGRRKGERSAERVAEAGLLLFCTVSLALSFGLVAARAGLIVVVLRDVVDTALLLMPGVIVAIGLFTIILLAADLADQARRLAATDILTGILNRRGFEDAAGRIIASARQHGRPVCIVLADIDRFKLVNDRFGHPAGDRVLCQICSTIEDAVGHRDLIARFGGEEFAIALPDCDVVVASVRIETLRREIAAVAFDLPEPHPVTLSFGLAALHDDDADLAAVLRRADAALYRSKADGRNRVTVA